MSGIDGRSCCDVSRARRVDAPRPVDAAATTAPAAVDDRAPASRDPQRGVDARAKAQCIDGACARRIGERLPERERVERRFSDAEVRAYAALLGEGRRSGVESSAHLFPPVKGDIFTGFRQGGTGNCVSVAAIKAAMTAFGPDRVFKSVKEAGDGLDITMRDDKQVHVPLRELNEAAAGSRFHGSDPGLLRRAIVMYAAMAKRAQTEGNDGQRNMSFRQAMGTLNNGEVIQEGAHWLGLDKSVRRVGAGDVGRHAAVVSANSAHAVFMTRGVQDWYGSARRGGWMGSAFALVGDR